MAFNQNNPDHNNPVPQGIPAPDIDHPEIMPPAPDTITPVAPPDVREPDTTPEIDIPDPRREG